MYLPVTENQIFFSTLLSHNLENKYGVIEIIINFFEKVSAAKRFMSVVKIFLRLVILPKSNFATFEEEEVDFIRLDYLNIHFHEEISLIIRRRWMFRKAEYRLNKTRCSPPHLPVEIIYKWQMRIFLSLMGRIFFRPFV